MPRLHCIALAIPLLLGACASMAPTYQTPASPVPASGPTGAAYAASATPDTAAAVLPWRSVMRDARLQEVIDLALANSRDLRKTVASIEAARAQYRVQDAAKLPTVNAGLGGSRAESLSGSGTVRSQSVSATVGLSAWELDLFGRVRSLTDASLETYLATEEASRSTRISLIAETANAWLALAADQSRLALATRTLESAQRSMTLVARRLDAGVASRVEVRQAETVYQQARADLAGYTTAVAQDRNALELLVGHAVEDRLLPTDMPAEAAWLAEVPAGLSSDVLLSRPDVLQAEHTLKSASANIGAARAALFPSLSLTASGGVASAALSSLFSGGATIWSIAPALNLPLFDGGSGRANVAAAQAQQALQLSTYELTVQTAFREVADALARRGTMAEQVAAQTALVEAASDSQQLAEARYTKGVDTYLNSLDAQRTLYSAEQALITIRLTALENRVTLYRVLGGGVAGS